MGGRTYHDVWLSEGFAQFSAGLYVHRVKGEKEFREFLEAERSDVDWAENGLHLPTLLVQEGGYSLEMLPILAESFLTGYLGGRKGH